MNKLIEEMRLKNLTRNKVSATTGLSKPTVRKYLKEPELFPVKSARVINNLLNVEDDYGFKELFR